VENSSLTGTPANPMNGAGNAPIPAVSGLVLYGGEVQLAKAVVTPGSSLLPAILAQPGSGSNAPAPSVRVLEGTILGGAISAPAIVRNSASMPTVTATSTQPGGSIMAEVRQPTGTLCILLVGLPGLPVKFPGIVDAFWLDPAEYEFAELGTPQPNMPLTHSIAVPNLAGLQSFLAGWQAVSLDPVELQASNPSVSLIY